MNWTNESFKYWYAINLRSFHWGSLLLNSIEFRKGDVTLNYKGGFMVTNKTVGKSFTTSYSASNSIVAIFRMDSDRGAEDMDCVPILNMKGCAVPGLDDEKSCIEACRTNESCKAAFLSQYDKSFSKEFCFLDTDVLSLTKVPKFGNYYSSAHLKIRSSPNNGSKTSASHSSLALTLLTLFTCVVVVLMITIVLMLVLQKKRIDDWSDHGRGEIGSVYKGVLKNGTIVAVKQLQARHGIQRFVVEVETAGNIHHINLILINIAKGLTYLHEECRHEIAHLDVKPHNILLDDNFNAKLSYFGLSTMINRDEISRVVAGRRGTLGYQTPEW
ncbi:Serine/threonine protein kinase [Parasponia andersonii]|uniref:Serine/threonine protein kinase n=1 Tax=Parasponia andersonii TaxID=3476 RepID=A0A2P5E508_PARAD|nr:Serine/threonine protein kinase [Parasponia andersonii]